MTANDYVRYYFHITDVQFNDEYDYTADFVDHWEADRFITENENDGNTIIIYKYEYIPAAQSHRDDEAIFLKF